MESHAKLERFAQRRLPLILSGYILMQPLLDILTSIGVKAGQSVTAGVVVRPLFMVLGLLYVIFVSRFEGKKACLVFLGALIFYLALFLARMFSLGGLPLCAANLKELVKTFYAPFVLVFLYAVYRQYGHLISTRTLAITGGIYTGVILLAFLTGTSNVSYGNSGYGYNGWFYAANEIGCIISIVGPITVCYCLTQLPSVRPKTWWKGVLIAAALVSLVFSADYIGTKVVFGFTAIYCLAACIWSLIRWIQTRKPRFALWAGVLLVLTAAVIGFYFHSPLQAYLDNVYIPIQDKTSEIAAVSMGEDIQAASAGTWLMGIIDGSPLVQKLDWLLSRRLLTSASSLQVYLDGSLLTKLLGIGYADAPSYTRGVEYMIEMDPYAILVRHGILGFFLYIVPYFAALVWLVVRFFKHPARRLASLEYCSYLYASLVSCAIAVFAGHALVSPAVSIFVLVTGLALWAHTQRQDQEHPVQ